ncbi:asparaginyl-tRNA synthetase [Desulfobulbus propionicus DSM 2032]|jgi:asparaginyl-tRNA synthetase|uniref:Asparagine--tRNA ligase n=1 Tax=Desulfobulbus propionicus (strain ATCC 33891 / DSM 2032 / VKM B-1956 / 1pr3) TaxID=577650 RepID=A0A7U3YLB4_DESPD|nr:asparagine--tRNA ligase [Desulfobulbus propionicus]ADW17479.1 asparaginyl-tRNA synthetase [Desulfobulbus propionicus DSM 2032]
MHTTSIVDLLRRQPVGETVTISGWVRTRRDSGSFSFLEINDGSCLANLQLIAEEQLVNYASEVKKLTTGCSLRAHGLLVASPAKGQTVEVRAERIEVIGWADPETYPLQKKRHSFEFLRSIAHLRPRTNALGAVARVRSALSFAIHRFFHEHGFLQVHTPVITTSDCEGAGEMFTVTALEPGQLQGPDPFNNDFFGRRAGLTVSGQLQAEIFALSHGRVYTFGPTFRAEHSNTSRHLAEFWMLEPEMAFCDLAGNRDVAESLIKFLVCVALDECGEDLALFDQHVAKGLIDKLTQVRDRPFVHLPYTDAVTELQRAGRQFEFPVQWGIDLQAEHERFLCEEVAQAPVVVTNYPADIKPFYMRLDDDGRTVAAMDILVAGIGELIGGSQREERYEVLAARMAAAGLDLAQYGWYLDLRRYGSVPHSGFGLGFERLVQFVTGMQNIRDVIPFPRTPGSAPC